MIRSMRASIQNLDSEDGFDDSDKVTKLKLILSQIQTISDDFQQTINNISAEEELINRRKRATNQNEKHDSDDDCDDSVKMNCQISTEVRSTDLRHLSKRKLQSFIASLEEKSIHAEYKNETIMISVPYDRKEDLAVALQNELFRLDRTVYYVHDVTPQIIFLLELYQRQTGNKMKYVYVETEQEIKIRDSLEVYETIKKKCKMFPQYQIDNLDMSKASMSVKDKIREYNSTREPRFENILLEVLKGNKAINIHYPVNEQNRALEVKNLLLFQLGLVKPTGRRNRRFDDFTSLQETFKQNDNTWDEHEVITEEGSQYGDIFTSASPSMPSMNTNAMSDDISSITSSYNNSNQLDSNNGNRPSDMVSGRLGGNATLRPEASCFSSKSQRLDVQTDKEQGSQYGDEFTSASPSMPSMNTNAMSDEISSITSSYNNSNQRDSNHGNRPSDMVSGRLGGNATLRPEASCFSSKKQHLDVQTVKEQGSQYGDIFTRASPSMPSMNTNAMSDDISSITSSYNNSNQRDSNHGNRPSDMVPGRLGGNAPLRPETSSFSSKGAYSLPVSRQRLDVQTDKTKAKEDPIKEAVYCTEKNLVIKVYNGNILKLDVDCIVNAANDGLLHWAGVAGAISRAAGSEFDKESSDYIHDNGSLDVGQCIGTGAENLPYSHVLHVVGPQWEMYEDKADCEHDLMMTIYNTLRRAEVLRMKSLALPSISSGLFGVPWNVCAEQYARGVERFEEDSQGVVQEVHFVDINSDILIEIRSVFSHMFKVLASHED